MDPHSAAPVPDELPLSGERRTRRRPGENRERLITAATIDFAIHGYRGSSTASIGARAGVPQPHVYASFQSKRELYVAAIERVRAALGALSPNGADTQPASGDRVPSNSTRLHRESAPLRADLPGAGVCGGLLVQALASVADPEVGEASRSLVTLAQQLLGQDQFAESLLGGSDYLMEVSE